ncbi:glycosyl transferase [Scytonema millei]|uniref:Glycosyl transferase n=1 Tax=Scytonema millei VB511283 TaxID=1245923 RepID=A0A9X5E3H2_9CYAN|nr:glycosyl transferase [Scytonema millei]NHC34098.1 glycosyl transferase [Scytonema millei VB511283]
MTSGWWLAIGEQGVGEQRGNNCQPSTVNRQPSTVNRQPSTVNRQPSTVNHQPMTNDQ